MRTLEAALAAFTDAFADALLCGFDQSTLQ
jgi:hypothetical protein